MFENFIKNKGWFERPDISGKAPRHFEVSRKRQFENEFPTGSAVNIEPKDEIDEIVGLHFKLKDETERKSFENLCLKFYDLHREEIDDVGFAIKDSDATVYVPITHSDDFIQYAKENKFTINIMEK